MGLARATYYRTLAGATAGEKVIVPHRERTAPHWLSDAEQGAVVEALNSPELVDKSIRQGHFAMLEAGHYLCSLATSHRIMRAAGQSGDRRRQSAHPHRRRVRTPHLGADRPRQVWCWDITALPGPGRQVFKFYSVIDLYSRKIVAWRVERSESAPFAEEMINQAVTAEGIRPFVLHADNGAPMRAGTVRDLLATLQITASYSRPRVSNDNPFIESFFKTCKYDLSWPGRFDSLDHARQWVAQFVEGYNSNHHHSALGGHTPASVHDGSWPTHQLAWDQTKAAYAAAHPERHRKPPITHQPPDVVWINKPNELSQTA